MLTLKDGKFYDGDKVVPIEFGNNAQINLMSKVDQLYEDGVLAFVDESLTEDKVAIKYLCVCGTQFTKITTTDEWNSLSKDKFKCSGCSLNYILDGESYHPYIVVKLQRKKG